MANTTPTVSFGVPSLMLKETPQIATTIATICLYLAAIVNGALLFFPQIPNSIKVPVGEWSAASVGFVHFICNMFGLNPTGPNAMSNPTSSSSASNSTLKVIFIIAMLGGLTGACSGQSIFKPLPKPATHSANVYVRTLTATANGDSTFTGFRLTGLTVLYGVSNGYTASNVYGGTGVGWEWGSYSSATQRWTTNFQIGAGLYAGGHIAPANLQAATAVGVQIGLLNKQIIIGILYNLNSPAGMNSHWVGAVGGNAFLVPTN